MRHLMQTAVILSAVVWTLAVEAAPKVGKAAPGFRLRARDGALFNLADVAYPGAAQRHRPKQVVVLDFFRTDCAPCRKSLPKLVSLHKQYGKSGLKIVLVALLEDKSGEAKLDAFLRSQNLPFSVIVDPYAVAAKKYVYQKGSVKIPALFVIDRQGVLRVHLQGLTDDKALRSLKQSLQALLKKS